MLFLCAGTARAEAPPFCHFMADGRGGTFVASSPADDKIFYKELAWVKNDRVQRTLTLSTRRQGPESIVLNNSSNVIFGQGGWAQAPIGDGNDPTHGPHIEVRAVCDQNLTLTYYSRVGVMDPPMLLGHQTFSFTAQGDLLMEGEGSIPEEWTQGRRFSRLYVRQKVSNPSLE